MEGQQQHRQHDEQHHHHHHQRGQKDYKVGGLYLNREELKTAYNAFQRFDKDGSGAIDTKVNGGSRSRAPFSYFFA